MESTQSYDELCAAFFSFYFSRTFNIYFIQNNIERYLSFEFTHSLRRPTAAVAHTTKHKIYKHETSTIFAHHL